ncbi:MAG: hypothetical protein ACLFNU_03135 [Bacteroidales bacterium]
MAKERPYIPASGYSYIAINLAFIIIILLIFAYSFSYRNSNHLIPALLTEKTGIIPPSKGLSASFSEIVRGNFNEALTINLHSMRIFAFFAIQFILRGAIAGFIYAKHLNIKKTLVADITISLALFIWCFLPLIRYTFLQIGGLLKQAF